MLLLNFFSKSLFGSTKQFNITYKVLFSYSQRINSYPTSVLYVKVKRTKGEKNSQASIGSKAIILYYINSIY